MSSRLSTPVAFLIFNRPDVTQVVFNEIAKARPSKLLVVADGPRTGRTGEAEACRATRAILDQVDWDCEVLTDFSDVNLGCGKRVSSGIDWVFSQVEEAIILEDDCVPSPSFFPYCQELLERYRDEPRVMTISGTRLPCRPVRTELSYDFSALPEIWGWASWRRAWKLYDFRMKTLGEMEKERTIENLFGDPALVSAWLSAFHRVQRGEVDTWDYQWVYAHFAHGGLVVQPSVNQVSNIGFGEQATHTKTFNRYADLPRAELDFPLRHPRFLCRDWELDIHVQREKSSVSRRAVDRLRHYLNAFGEKVT